MLSFRTVAMTYEILGYHCGVVEDLVPLTLKVRTLHSSETSVDIYQPIGRNVSEDMTLRK